MSGRQAKAARKAADPSGYFKDVKRPTQPYKSKREQQQERASLDKVLAAMHDVIVHGKGADEVEEGDQR